MARTDSTVLITGETGTGKELLARAIHNMSKRKDRPMITVNCASLPPTLIESELFGRERGAYTGALTKMVGRFEVADGSTLFLDEIGELPLELQSKLLWVLEEGKFERLGSTKTVHVDVRILAATNRDIAKDVAEGRFRRDLYYRLNVFAVGSGEVLRAISGGTNALAVRLGNTGQDAYFGIEGSVAGGYFTGSDAYAMVLYGNGSRTLNLLRFTSVTVKAGILMSGEDQAFVWDDGVGNRCVQSGHISGGTKPGLDPQFNCLRGPWHRGKGPG